MTIASPRSWAKASVVAGLLLASPNPAEAQVRPRPTVKPPAVAPATGGIASSAVHARRLKDAPDALGVLRAMADRILEMEMKVALVPLAAFHVGDCLGLRASAGEFSFRFDTPELRIEDTGVLLKFTAERIHMDALTVRAKPNPTNVSNPCTFGHRFELGGSASDVRLELRMDPIMDVRECRMTAPGEIRTTWRIGGLNLKPLQNDLDRAAKNMLEDAMTVFSNGWLADWLLDIGTEAIGEVVADCRG